jgi:hypothetical protein
MTLKDALSASESGVAEATINSLVYTVKDDQADFSPTEPDGEANEPNDYVLTIANGMMPPHVTKSYASLEEIEREHGGLDWSATEMES